MGPVFSPLKFLSAAILVLVLAAVTAQADSITFGSPGSSQYVTGSITAGDGTVTITLTNALSNDQVISIAQNISGIYFGVSGYSGSADLSSSGPNNAAGSLVLTNGQAAYTQGPVAKNWMVVNNVNGGLAVCVICPGTNAPAGPGYTIIGGTPWSNTAYVNANGSLNNNTPHNPFLAGTVTFTLDVPGVTASSTFNSVQLQFGTSATPPTSVPEAGSVATTLLSAISILGGLVVRRGLKPA